MAPLGMTEEIATPTLVGFLFGIAYGSGVILRETRRRRLERRQVFLMSVFLSQVHAIVEDSLVTIAVGAAALWVVGFRLVWATAATALLGAVAAVAVRRGWGGGDVRACGVRRRQAGVSGDGVGGGSATIARRLGDQWALCPARASKLTCSRGIVDKSYLVPVRIVSP